MTGHDIARSRLGGALAAVLTVVLFAVAACEGLSSDEGDEEGAGGVIEASLPQPCERAVGSCRAPIRSLSTGAA